MPVPYRSCCNKMDHEIDRIVHRHSLSHVIWNSFILVNFSKKGYARTEWSLFSEHSVYCPAVLRQPCFEWCRTVVQSLVLSGPVALVMTGLSDCSWSVITVIIVVILILVYSDLNATNNTDSVVECCILLINYNYFETESVCYLHVAKCLSE